MCPDTPITYTRKESDQIRERFNRGDPELACPRCGEALLYGPRVQRRGYHLSEVYCRICHRVVMIRIDGEVHTKGR